MVKFTSFTRAGKAFCRPAMRVLSKGQGPEQVVKMKSATHGAPVKSAEEIARGPAPVPAAVRRKSGRTISLGSSRGAGRQEAAKIKKNGRAAEPRRRMGLRPGRRGRRAR